MEEGSATGVSAAKALLLSSSEDWLSLGQKGGITHADNLASAAEGITSLLLIRIIAIHKPEEYADLSTTSIATVIVNTGRGEWPAEVIPHATVTQLQIFVTRILEHYQADAGFHNFRHAYHVVLSCNKLLDQLLLTDKSSGSSPPENTPKSGAGDSNHPKRSPPTFGLRKDPTALFGLVFSALIHDVGHPGISNRQRVNEQDAMAIRYNDESVHENYALSYAFGEFLGNDFGDLRRTIFPADAHYRYFRKLVVDAVLSTDLASPVRIQISRSKFQEAFSEEGEVLMWNEKEERRSSLSTGISGISNPRAKMGGILQQQQPLKNSRRGSTQSVSSVVSDISTDSYAAMVRNRVPAVDPKPVLYSRRMSNHSIDSNTSDYDSVFKGGNKEPRRGLARNLSTDSNDSMLDYVEKAMNGEPILPRRTGQRRISAANSSSNDVEEEAEYEPSHRHSLQESADSVSSSYGSYMMAAESINLAKNRKKGTGLSRPRKPRSESEHSAKQLTEGSGTSEDDDLSLTPPSSDDEMEGVVITGASGRDNFSPSAFSGKMGRRRSSIQNRRGSTGSTAVFNIQEEAEDFNESGNNLAYEIEAKHRSTFSELQGLGIRRSMDLSGESIDQYSVRDSLSVVSDREPIDAVGPKPDEPDEFRSAVVLELILRTADISYWFQNEDVFLEWSRNLLRELMAAHQVERGMDPRPKWVQNQINMAQEYVAVLAIQLQHTGIFGDDFNYWFPFPDDALAGEWRFPMDIMVKPLASLNSGRVD
jgi:hypothetical protein